MLGVGARAYGLQPYVLQKKNGLQPCGCKSQGQRPADNLRVYWRIKHNCGSAALIYGAISEPVRISNRAPDTCSSIQTRDSAHERSTTD